MSKFLILAAGMPAALAGKGKHGDLTEEERAAKKEEFEAKMLAEYGEDWKEQHPHGKGGKEGTTSFLRNKSRKSHLYFL